MPLHNTIGDGNCSCGSGPQHLLRLAKIISLASNTVYTLPLHIISSDTNLA